MIENWIKLNSLSETSLHSLCAEFILTIDWDLSTDENEESVQTKWRENTDCDEVKKLSSTLISEWKTFDCRHWLNMQFEQCLQDIIDLYWEISKSNVKQSTAVKCDT